MYIKGLKYRWHIPVKNTGLLYTHASALNLAVPIVQILHSRGIQTQHDIEQFIFSLYEKDVANPALLKDAAKAVDRILVAIEKKEKILIAGDYDVDGITSTALLLTCLVPLQANINFFLPNRVKDGYGLSVKTVERTAKNGYRLIITVDNGITAFEPVQAAQKLGIDVIITDHHKPHQTLPEAFAIVDPHQSSCHYPFKFFAGVGVSFKLMQLLYERLDKQLPQKVFELLLLGTVADVVPLIGENRFWVRYGLQQIHQEESFSLTVLKQHASCTQKKLSSTDIGFYLTPQINALGRLDDARAGVAFLLGTDKESVIATGMLLADLNNKRKRIESEIVEQIKAHVTATVNLDTAYLIVAAHEAWSPGVIGLAASRIVSHYHRPTIILHLGSNGLAKGSCRSIPQCNIFEALCSVSDILHTFGGHPMAAGLSLDIKNIPLLQERLQAYMEKCLSKEDLTATLTLDAEITVAEATNQLMNDMQYLEPFGCENTQPKFYIKQASLVGTPQLLKGVHTKCLIFADGAIKSIIFFQRPDLYELFVQQPNMSFSCAVTLTRNEWQGKKSIEFQGLDIFPLALHTNQ